MSYYKEVPEECRALITDPFRESKDYYGSPDHLNVIKLGRGTYDTDYFRDTVKIKETITRSKFQITDHHFYRLPDGDWFYAYTATRQQGYTKFLAVGGPFDGEYITILDVGDKYLGFNRAGYGGKQSMHTMIWLHDSLIHEA